MKIKIVPLANQENIKKILRPISKKNADKEANMIVDFVKRQYSRTFRFWNDSGENNKFPPPQVDSHVQIIWSGAGHTIIVKTNVENPVWGFLDKGTRTIIQPKTSPPINERINIRTFVNQLDVNPFPGFTGRKFVIRAGTLRRGIEGRMWTQLIGREVQHSYFSRYFRLKRALAHGTPISI